MTLYFKVLAVCATIIVVGLTTTTSVRGQDWQPLHNDPEISNGFTILAIGNRIRKVCPDIDARLVRALGFVQTLRNRAGSMGYSGSEIDTFIDEEDWHYNAIARQYLAERGAELSDIEAVCRVGRDEIAAQSPIGRLLREG